jgi:hypothetical protein
LLLSSSAIAARRRRRPTAQRLAALGGIDAAVLVEIAAREVAVGLGHELGLADEAVLVGVDTLEIGRLTLELPVARQDVARCRRAREQLVLAELAVLVGISP